MKHVQSMSSVLPRSFSHFFPFFFPSFLSFSFLSLFFLPFPPFSSLSSHHFFSHFFQFILFYLFISLLFISLFSIFYYLLSTYSFTFAPLSFSTPATPHAPPSSSIQNILGGTMLSEVLQNSKYISDLECNI